MRTVHEARHSTVRGFVFVAALAVSISSVGCRRPDSQTAGCSWRAEAPLAFQSSSERQRHLRDDAEAAERIAVQFSESAVELGVQGERLRVKEECEARLWESIARVHQTTLQEVRNSMRRQNDMPF